jgi:hypothetical protein
VAFGVGIAEAAQSLWSLIICAVSSAPDGRAYAASAVPVASGGVAVTSVSAGWAAWAMPA